AGSGQCERRDDQPGKRSAKRESSLQLALQPARGEPTSCVFPHAPVISRATDSVRATSSSNPTPSKPGSELDIPPRSGSDQRLSMPSWPANAPVIAPTVAPLESVSQPPATTRPIAVSKSPRDAVRA